MKNKDHTTVKISKIKLLVNNERYISNAVNELATDILDSKETHHHYTKEQVEYVRNNLKGRSWDDMTELFNERFNTSLKSSHLKTLQKNYGLKNGMSGKTPWNKGIKGLYKLPNRYMKKYKEISGKHPRSIPIGSEHEKKGYIRIKVAEPNVWKYKHVFLWEQLHGVLPKGQVIIFADKNNRNFAPDNLIAVTRKELIVMNKCGLIYDNADATRAGKTIADIKIKIREGKK